MTFLFIAEGLGLEINAEAVLAGFAEVVAIVLEREGARMVYG